MTMYYKILKDNHHTTGGTLVRTCSFKNIDYIMMKGQYGFNYKYCYRFSTAKEICFTSLETSSLNNPFLILASYHARKVLYTYMILRLPAKSVRTSSPFQLAER